ncbi:uncharacterized protein [Rutidosis leptorrhynchoides]|uniref:uncharacterized protein n=1 Tax=Rutidosis leptorrhynchoides TaxID=125765 RepID=UPI003A9A4D39
MGGNRFTLLTDDGWYRISRKTNKTDANKDHKNKNDQSDVTTSFYVHKIPDHLDAKRLWILYEPYGQIVDSYIPSKRSKHGNRFGFVRFKDIVDKERFARGAHVGVKNINISHLLYGDDALIVSEWNHEEIKNIIRIFNIFFVASGLKKNVSKSNVYGINVNNQEISEMASLSGCSPGSICFTYLGLLLGSNMNLITNWKPLIDKFKKRLSAWQYRMLSYGGRLSLIESVLCSIGIYYLSIFKCPKTVIQTLEGLRRTFFWGGDDHIKRMSWIKWDSILSSLDKDGLGIGSLEAFNLALMFKWIWRFYTQPNHLWMKVICSIYGQRGAIENVNGLKNGIWINLIKGYSQA